MVFAGTHERGIVDGAAYGPHPDTGCCKRLIKESRAMMREMLWTW